MVVVFVCLFHAFDIQRISEINEIKPNGLIRPINQSSCDQPTATSGGAPENQWMDTAKQSESSGEEDMSIEKAYKMWPFDAR